MSNKVKIIVGVVIVIVAVLGVWYGVARDSNIPSTKNPIKVGVLADLSGDYVSFLRGIPRGVELAVEDLMKETDREIKLIIEDQKSCDAKETVTIMNKFVGVDKVDVIIGGTCSNTTLAAAPVANQNKTIMISAASSAPTISQAGEYVFRTYISDVFRASSITELAYGIGKRRMAIIIETTNDAAIEMSKGGIKGFEAMGGVVLEEKITNEDTDFRTQLAKIKNFNPDVLCLVITGPSQAGLFVKQAKEMGIEVQLISPSETVEDASLIEVAGNAVEGLIYAMPGNPPETSKYQTLKSRYMAKYGEDTVPSYTTEAYDAVMLGVKAVLASDGSKEDVKDELFKVSKSYTGVSGNVSFDSNGDVTKPVMFKTIKNGQFVPYSQ